jgi:putative SOS response-associated peptidase YedK
MVITEPNAFVARYHDQMPVVLGKDQIGPWLSGEAGAELLMPAANDALKAWSVSRKVSTSKAPNEPSLIVEVAL